jgi:hypothetical protein
MSFINISLTIKSASATKYLINLHSFNLVVDITIHEEHNESTLKKNAEENIWTSKRLNKRTEKIT